MKRILSLLLALILILASAVPVFAEESEAAVSPRYTYIASLTSALSINKSGVATLGGSCWAPDADHVTFTCRLQKHNGSSWVTVRTWSTTEPTSCTINKTYSVYSGYTYRVRTTCAVYNSSDILVESGTCYSDQISY